MWCLHCHSERTQSLLELELDSGVEGEAPSSETTTSLDSPSAYHQGPLVSASSLSPDHYEHASVGAYGLYSGPPGQQRARRPKLQHSTSILRKQAEEDAIKRSRSLSESYELSSDLQDKQVEMLERKYGGRLVTRHAARTIQTAFRQYQMNKNFERLRSSMSENRMSRRIVLSNMRMQFSFEGPEKVHSSYFEGKQVSVTNDGSQLGSPVPSECGDVGEPVTLKSPATSSDFADAITELEDAFSRQVKSLAESIDDALNCRSLHTEETPAPDTARARDTEPKAALHSMDHRKRGEMTASYSDVTLYIDEEELSPPLPLSQGGDRPSSTESDLRLRAGGVAQDYWALAHKADKADTDTSCHSTPSLERPEPRLRADHLPLLTIEPPSDSSADLSDRSDRSSIKRQSAYERGLGGGQQGSPKHGPHSGPPKILPREEPEPRPRPPGPSRATWPSMAQPTGRVSQSRTTQMGTMTASTARPTPTTPSTAVPSPPHGTACGSRPSASRPTTRRPATAGTHRPSATMSSASGTTASASTSSTRSLRRACSTLLSGALCLTHQWASPTSCCNARA